MKPAKNKKARRSSCGAPIPSFKSELDQLEKELQEDEEENQRRRQRRDRRKQNKQLESEQSANSTSLDAKPLRLVLESAGDANDDDDDDDDDGLLSFSFRGNVPLTVSKETKPSECQVQVDSEPNENNDDDEMDHCIWDPLDDEGCATAVPLAESTNSQRAESDPAARTERSPAKPLSQAEVLAVNCQSPTASTATAVEAAKEASDDSCAQSQVVVEIFERSDDCDPLDDEECATAVPLAESTNSRPGKNEAALRTERSPAKQSSQAAVLTVMCRSPSVTETAGEATKEASDVACTLSQAVVEIFERSDVETCTCKQVWKQLEEQHGFELNQNSKKLVRLQLTSLIQQYLQARACSESTFPSYGSDATEIVNKIGPAADRTSRSSGERKPTNEVQAVNDQSSSLPSFHSHIAQDPTSDHPRESKLDVVSKRRKLPPELNPTHRTKSEPANGAPPVTLSAPQPKRRGRPPKASKMSANPKVAQEGDSRGVKRIFQGAVDNESTSAPTPPRKAKRIKPQCSLCNACPCRHPAAPVATSVMSLAQSDAAVEKALMRRLLKLEQATDRYEEQTEAVRRKLKKHRREMWRKIEPPNESSHRRSAYRFLPDADDMDRESAARSVSTLLDQSTVLSAKSSMFSFASSYQPTLTQMFGCQLTNGTARLDGLDAVELDPALEEDRQSQVNGDASDEMPAVGEAVDSCPRADGNDDALDFERVEIQNGVDLTEETTRIWGSYSSAGGYKSLWDRIFDDPKEAEALTLEQLETMFDDFLPPASVATQSSQINLSMLTQRGRRLADEIRGRINLSPDRLARLTSSCPEWEENILFALRQGCAGDVRTALAGVAEAQSKLLRSKEAILKAIETQAEALTVFSEALTASLTRFDSDSPTPSPALSVSILDQRTRASIDRCDGDASEVKTLSVSSSSPTSSQEETYG